MSSGSYQEYDPKLYKVYEEGEGFKTFDITTETAEDRAEREWAQVNTTLDPLHSSTQGPIPFITTGCRPRFS